MSPVGRLLMTGARGTIGVHAAARCERDGWSVRSYDLVDGDDILDPAALDAATEGCDAVVHAAAIPHDYAGTPADIIATNLLGTWHVLEAAERHQVARVVVFSSIQVFGCSNGEGDPDYLPVDDDHPRRATRPYGMSKVLVEDMCERWTTRTGIPTVLLRPAATPTDALFARLNPAGCEFAAYVHVDDVADATARALRAPVDGHLRVLLAAAGDVDTSRARDVLGWEATRRQTSRDRVRRRVRRGVKRQVRRWLPR